MITLATISILFAACLCIATIKFVLALTRPAFDFEALIYAANKCAEAFRKMNVSAVEMSQAITKVSLAMQEANPEWLKAQTA